MRCLKKQPASVPRPGPNVFAPSRFITRPNVIEVAEGIPFTELTGMSVEKLYALKGEIVSRGIKAVTDVNIPIFPKRRFQHGALSKDKLRQRLPEQETQLRSQFLSLYI